MLTSVTRWHIFWLQILDTIVQPVEGVNKFKEICRLFDTFSQLGLLYQYIC